MDKIIGIIWPTAEHLFDEIVAALRASEKITVISEMEITLTDRFEAFVFDLYDDNDYEQYGYLIDNKIHLITSRTGARTIRVVYMESSNLNIKRFKSQIRSAFKNRVASYEYDIIIHLTDSEQEYLRTDYTVKKYRA